ncbi:hypothetical protein ACSRUE_06565 [Sorangium sp. KYC3313]|uniref:hypothetical protein n=1 Tax=Sorangium sp. KYC3313 TaxID=3449740 RepID=UPI003F8A010B
MKKDGNTPADLLKRIERKAPEYLDLLTAESDTEVEQAFNAILDVALRKLESNRTHFAPLDEVGLTAVLSAALSVPGLTVIQEAHSNGHVDITIDFDHCVPARRKLGEAKIDRGPRNHAKGLEQLLDRYTTGRELGGLLIVYVLRPNIIGRVKKLRDAMDTSKPSRQKGTTRPHVLQWAFASTHVLNSGDHHEVSHVACNMCP